MKTEKIKYYDTYEETLNNCERYILRVAQRMNIDEHLDDMLQSGRLGLWEAYNKYNPESGPFHGYAISYIRGKILTYLTDNARTIRIPYQQLSDKHSNHNPNGVKPEDIKTISTSITIGEDSRDTIGDMLEEEIEEDNSYDDGQLLKLAHLRKHISTLKERQVKIIWMRHERDMSFSEIAEELQITRAGAYDQYKKAIETLQRAFNVEEGIKKGVRYCKHNRNK